MKQIIALVFVCVLLLCLAGCSSAGSAFEDAVAILEEPDAAFDIEGEEGVINTKHIYYTVAEDGSYITIDTNPIDFEDFYSPEAAKLVQDVNSALGFPESLYEKMLQTRAMDGKQTDENDNFEVSWSYHPDSGMTVMYEKK